MKVPDGTYEGRYHNINPCEALEALEKQAPEVLREWVNRLGDRVQIGQQYDLLEEDKAPWIAVSEQKPPENTWIVTKYEGLLDSYGAYEYMGDGFIADKNGSYTALDCTHWMPIPE